MLAMPPHTSKTPRPKNYGPTVPVLTTGGLASNGDRKVGVRRPRVTSEGYVTEWCPDRKRYVYQHRLVIEAELGRHLDRREVVHHRNHDRTDNRRENLSLHPNQKDHIQEHVRRGTWGWPKGKPRPSQEKPTSECPICREQFKPKRRNRADTKTCSESCGQTLRYRDRPHGANRYKSGCRCDECKAGWASLCRERRARKRAP